MNLLKRTFNKFRPKKPLDTSYKPELAAAIEAITIEPPAKEPEPPKPHGRVVKQTRAAEFNPNPSRRGGRIVKVMPRQLQKIKQAQEKLPDE